MALPTLVGYGTDPTVGPLTAALLQAYLNEKVYASGGDVSNCKINITGAPTPRSMAAEAEDWPHASRWGVVADGVTDDTVALNLALASGYDLRMPLRPMVISGPLLFRTPGQRVYFPNRCFGGFMVAPGFSLGSSGASGILDFDVPSGIPVGPATDSASAGGVGSQCGPIIENLRLVCQQPDSSTLSSFTQYPPAMWIANTPRITLIRPRLVGAWRGMVFGENSGGAIVHEAELACFATNIEIDGCADSMRFYGPHIWPFELTALQFEAFFLPAVIGWKLGRCDDLKVDGGLFLVGQQIIATNGDYTGSLAGPTFGCFTNCGFDTLPSIQLSAGYFRFIGGYFSFGSIGGTGCGSGLVRTGSTQVLVTGNWIFVGQAPTNNVIFVDESNTEGGFLNFTGNTLDFTDVDCIGVYADGTASNIVIGNNTFHHTPGTVKSAPDIGIISGTGCVISGNWWSPFGAGGSGTAYANTSTSVPLAVTGNVFNGRTQGTPGGLTVSAGNTP